MRSKKAEVERRKEVGLDGYGLIYADPPWLYRDKALAGQRGASCKYGCLSVEELCALDVEAIAAADCLLAMWWTGPMVREALRVMEAWGFELKTMTGFTWAKRTVNGRAAFGMGHWTRANAENCLFATRGKPTRMDAGVSQLVYTQVGEHSVKPWTVGYSLEKLVGKGARKVELFARKARPGWDVWGDEVACDVVVGTRTGTDLARTGTDGRRATGDGRAGALGVAG